MKRPALQNKQVVVFRMAFRARKVFGTFEKRAPGLKSLLKFNAFHGEKPKFFQVILDSEMLGFSPVVSCRTQVEFCVYISVESRILCTGNGG